MSTDCPNRIAIIGGGPAGLSAAKLLAECGLTNVTVFEADNRIGGKSHTVFEDMSPIELGTCYATLAHKVTNRWMASLGLKMVGIGEQRFDGEDFMDYVKSGSGAPLPVQVLNFWREYAKFQKAMSVQSPSQETLQQAAQPIQEWLQARNLPKMERFMHRGLTALGYGYIDETPTVQALRWCNMSLILTGAMNRLRMPVEGWMHFWQALTKNLDIRTNSSVLSVERTSGGVTVRTASGEERFDTLICAIPPDEFATISKPSSDEQTVANALEWQKYSVAVFAADDWFTKWRTEGYSAASLPAAKRGQIIAARTESYESELGGQLYLTGQIPGPYNDSELAELLRNEVADKGGNVTNLIMQKTWKYFPKYKPEAIRSGLIRTMRQMQGHNRTWYTGAAFSHEAVSNIVNFNVGLVRDMQAHLIDAQQGDHA